MSNYYEDIIMRGSTLVLSSSVLTKLNAVAGDRITIGYIDNDGELTPIICKGEDGNILSKANTIRFSGKQQERLSHFGSAFKVIEHNGMLELQGDGQSVFTKVEKAVETLITKEIISDTNFNITKLTDYEF